MRTIMSMSRCRSGLGVPRQRRNWITGSGGRFPFEDVRAEHVVDGLLAGPVHRNAGDKAALLVLDHLGDGVDGLTDDLVDVDFSP